MIARTCIGCGDVIAAGSYCSDCKPKDSRPRDRATRKNSTRWKSLSKRLRRLQPFCTQCGAASNLSVDHIVPFDQRPDWEHEIFNCQVLCLSCNRAKSDTPASPETIAAIEEKISDRKRRRRRVGDDPASTSAPTRCQPQRAMDTRGIQ